MHHLSKIADSEVLTRPYVHVLFAVVAIHEEQAGVREIVHMEELTFRAARAPHFELVDPGQLGLVKPSDECGEHVAALEVEVVIWPV